MLKENERAEKEKRWDKYTLLGHRILFVNFYIEDLWRKSSNNVSVYRVFKGCKPDTVKDVKLAKREVPQGKPPKV